MLRNQKYHEQEECAKFIREEYEKKEKEKIMEMEEEQRRSDRVMDMQKARRAMKEDKEKAEREKEKAEKERKEKEKREKERIDKKPIGSNYSKPVSKPSGSGRALPDYYSKIKSEPTGVATRSKIKKESDPKVPSSYYQPIRGIKGKNPFTKEKRRKAF